MLLATSLDMLHRSLSSPCILAASCLLLAACDEDPARRLDGERVPTMAGTEAASAPVDTAPSPTGTPGIFVPAHDPATDEGNACRGDVADASATLCGPTLDASAATDSAPVPTSPEPSASGRPGPAQPSAARPSPEPGALPTAPEPTGSEPAAEQPPSIEQPAAEQPPSMEQPAAEQPPSMEQPAAEQPSSAAPPGSELPSTDPGPERALPDLVLDGDYLRTTLAQDFVDASADLCLLNEGCVTGDGMRRVVRFGTRSGNIGNADLQLGRPEMENPLWEFDECHEHYHFEGYARYDLIEAGTTQLLPIGYKNGFCLRDNESWDLDADPSGCGAYTCADQGLSQGCADVYTPDLPCQWLDITDVAPGTYELRVSINAEQNLAELSFDNNSVSVRIEISDTGVAVAP